MSDVFISYAREDEAPAERLANALEAHGWMVWWDRKIPFGQPFDEVIDEALRSARCVLVVWSVDSIGSRWVLEEAHYAYERNILVPVSVDDVPPPIGFRRAQTANLVGWDGGTTSPAFRKLLADICDILEATSDASHPAETPESIDYRRRAVEGERRAWREPQRGERPTKRTRQNRSPVRRRLSRLVSMLVLLGAAGIVLSNIEPRSPPGDGGEALAPSPEGFAPSHLNPPPTLVRDAQQELQRLEYYRGRVDGVWGPQSRSALEAFQRKHDLEPTGIVTADVLAQLKLAPSQTPVVVASPTEPEPTVAPPPQRQKANHPSSPECIITITNPLVDLKYEPYVHSADIQRIPVGDYSVLRHTWVTFGAGKQLWFKVHANGREGWVWGNNWSIASRRGPSCP